MTTVAQMKRIHPVRDYLDTLKWDKKKRIDTWLMRFGGAEDTPYVRAVSRMFLVAAVARIYRPGCKVDHTLVLEGAQGIGKSTLLKHLFSEEFFLELSTELGTKDCLQSLRAKWGIELAELDSLSRTEISPRQGHPRF